MSCCTDKYAKSVGEYVAAIRSGVSIDEIDKDPRMDEVRRHALTCAPCRGEWQRGVLAARRAYEAEAAEKAADRVVEVWSERSRRSFSAAWACAEADRPADAPMASLARLEGSLGEGAEWTWSGTAEMPGLAAAGWAERFALKLFCDRAEATLVVGDAHDTPELRPHVALRGLDQKTVELKTGGAREVGANAFRFDLRAHGRTNLSEAVSLPVDALLWFNSGETVAVTAPSLGEQLGAAVEAMRVRFTLPLVPNVGTRATAARSRKLSPAKSPARAPLLEAAEISMTAERPRFIARFSGSLGKLVPVLVAERVDGSKTEYALPMVEHDGEASSTTFEVDIDFGFDDVAAHGERRVGDAAGKLRLQVELREVVGVPAGHGDETGGRGGKE